VYEYVDSCKASVGCCEEVMRVLDVRVLNVGGVSCWGC